MRPRAIMLLSRGSRFRIADGNLELRHWGDDNMIVFYGGHNPRFGSVPQRRSDPVSTTISRVSL